MFQRIIDGTAMKLAPVTHEMIFDGASDQADVAVTTCKTTASRLHFSLDDTSFIGRHFARWDDVLHAANNPYEPDLRIVDEIMAALEGASLPLPVEVKRRPRWDEDGGEEVCVDRYRAGDDYWRAIRPRQCHGPRVITLLAQVGGACFRSARELLFKGAVALVLARLLETSGYRTEIVGFGAFTGSYTDGSSLLYSTRLKAAGDAIDVVALTNLFSGWYFRTVSFGGMYATGKPMNSGMGRPMERAGQEIARHIAGEQARAWLIENVYRTDDAIEYARKMLNQLNEEIARCA